MILFVFFFTSFRLKLRRDLRTKPQTPVLYFFIWSRTNQGRNNEWATTYDDNIRFYEFEYINFLLLKKKFPSSIRLLKFESASDLKVPV